MVTLYNVTSSDGFIARIDGSEDFIPDDLKLWQKFIDLCLKYKILILGRKSYESIQGYDYTLKNSLELLPIKKIVVSRNKSFQLKDGYTLVNSIEEAIKQAPDALVSGGPNLNNYLLEHNFVKRIIQYKLPISIGDGIKPFDKNSLEIENYDWSN